MDAFVESGLLEDDDSVSLFYTHMKIINIKVFLVRFIKLFVKNNLYL